MKKQKLLLAAALLAVIAVIWVLVLRSYLNVDEVAAQKEYVSKGDTYLEKELYVRAIPEYEAALAIDTGEENRNAIEERLLSTYAGYQDITSYVSLVEDRAAEGRATEEEFITAAEGLFEVMSTEHGLSIAKAGLSAYPESETLLNLYEENRYGFSRRNTSVQAIVPTADGSYMPAFNGEGWVYIDENGRLLMETQFEEATRYDDTSVGALSVVKIDGHYYAVTQSGAWYGRDETGVEEVKTFSNGRIVAKKDGKFGYYNVDFELMSSSYLFDDITENTCGVAAVQNDGKWAIISDDGDTVVDFKLEDVAINSLGAAFASDVAMVKKDGEWILASAEGNRIGEAHFANAKAPESDGYIAVADETGRWGFIDREGNLVIDYQYNDAYSFSDGVAAVKQGDTWVYISVYNKVVIDENYTEAYPFHNGVAIVNIVDEMSLLKLSYLSEE